MNAIHQGGADSELLLQKLHKNVANCWRSFLRTKPALGCRRRAGRKSSIKSSMVIAPLILCLPKCVSPVEIEVCSSPLRCAFKAMFHKHKVSVAQELAWRLAAHCLSETKLDQFRCKFCGCAFNDSTELDMHHSDASLIASKIPTKEHMSVSCVKTVSLLRLPLPQLLKRKLGKQKREELLWKWRGWCEL